VTWFGEKVAAVYHGTSVADTNINADQIAQSVMLYLCGRHWNVCSDCRNVEDVLWWL